MFWGFFPSVWICSFLRQGFLTVMSNCKFLLLFWNVLRNWKKVLGQHALVVMSRMFSAQPGHPMLFPQKEAILFLLSIFLFAFYIVLSLIKVVSPLPHIGSLTLVLSPPVSFESLFWKLIFNMILICSATALINAIKMRAPSFKIP